MKLPIKIFFFLVIVSINVLSQEVYLTSDEKKIYWQPNTKIEFKDFQDTNLEECLKYKEKYGTKMSASIGLYGKVDVPKKRGKFDKVYIAPGFCKKCSCILEEDSMELKVNQLLFDIAEVCARKAREELLDLQKEMKADNTNAMFFYTVKNKWQEKMSEFYSSVINEVLIEKKDSSYIKWRTITDEILSSKDEYATKPEECYRLIKNEAIEKGYKQAKTIMGDMWKKKDDTE